MVQSNKRGWEGDDILLEQLLAPYKHHVVATKSTFVQHMYFKQILFLVAA